MVFSLNSFSLHNLSILNQGHLKNIQSRKPNLEEVNREADTLLDSGRLDQGDTERVERCKEALGTRYTANCDKLLGIQNKYDMSFLLSVSLSFIVFGFESVDELWFHIVRSTRRFRFPF